MIGLSKPSSIVSVSICSGSASGPARINAGLPGIKRINENVVKGAKLSASFREHAIFDTRIITLLKVAEETNQTEFIFEKLYEQYSKELDYKSKQFANLLNPLLTILIGAIVGIVLIAMYLPMFKLSSVIG